MVRACLRTKKMAFTEISFHKRLCLCARLYHNEVPHYCIFFSIKMDHSPGGYGPFLCKPIISPEHYFIIKTKNTVLH